MSAGIAAVKWFSKWKSSPLAVSLLIVLVVFFCTIFVQRQGWLQFLEFRAYDFYLRYQPKADTSDPIVIVEMTEKDIHSPSLDYPIYDDKLAELLHILETNQPAVIGLDIWRDIPVPKSGVGLKEFNEVLTTYSNIVAIFTLGSSEKAPIAPPDILKSNSERIAYNDYFVIDSQVDRSTPRTLRASLFVKSAEGVSFDSLPFRLALLYLQAKGIAPEPDP